MTSGGEGRVMSLAVPSSDSPAAASIAEVYSICGRAVLIGIATSGSTARRFFRLFTPDSRYPGQEHEWVIRAASHQETAL